MSETEFTDEERAEAYEYAHKRITESNAPGVTRLDLDSDVHDGKTAALTAIPPEIADLTELTSLDLQNTQVSNLSALQGMSGLQGLSLNNTQVSDLSALQGLRGLQTLHLSNTQVSDLSALQGMSGLQGLSLNNTQVSDLSALQGMSGLQGLSLNNTHVSDLSALQGLSGLLSLNLNDTLVSDLSALQGMSGLQSLWLNDTQVSDLSALQGLSGLQGLYVNNTLVSDLSALQGMSALVRLDLNDTQVSDLAVLASHPSLRSIRFARSRVSDLSVLLTIPNLRVAAEEEKIPWGVGFAETPAATADFDLREISKLDAFRRDSGKVTLRLLDVLEARQKSLSEPPEQESAKPRFDVPDQPPVQLLDADMDTAELEQQDLHEECRIKAEELLQIVGGADNSAPRLSGAVKRYSALIQRDAADIGARAVWSPANTMEAVWETHEKATKEGRLNEELPNEIAATLNDLLQTHRVWFLGHPGAQAVHLHAQGHAEEPIDTAKREATDAVITAAENSPHVADDAVSAARESLDTAVDDLPAHRRALGVASDMAWNLVAAITRKAWVLAKGGTGIVLADAIVGGYVFEFVVANATALGVFANAYMSAGGTWWKDFIALVERRVKLRED